MCGRGKTKKNNPHLLMLNAYLQFPSSGTFLSPYSEKWIFSYSDATVHAGFHHFLVNIAAGKDTKFSHP